MNEPLRIALVVPMLGEGGGMASVARFLHDVVQQSDRYEAEFVSLAASSRDDTSVRLTAPRTWMRGVQTRRGRFDGVPYLHVGAVGAELEFQRYQPRRLLTNVLNTFDLVQVIAGTPAWAMVCRNAQPPVALQVATLAEVERETRLRSAASPLGWWRKAMTRLTARIDRWALHHIDAAFVENSWMQEYLHRHMPPGRITFAPPGVDASAFTPASDGYAGTGGPLLSVGRFGDARKNVRLLFRAYAALRRQRPAAPDLLLAGKSGPSDDDWALADRLHIRGHVAFLQEVTQEKLAALYRRASLLAVSSDEEGLGLTILEAMASGCPVVSTACGGPSTTVVEGETGYLVPVGDAEGLANAMQRVLDDEAAAAKMGRAGRKRVEKQFSRATAGQRFLAGYDRLLDR